MTEQVDPFGPFKVKICDDIAPEGEFEVQVVDEDGNLMDIETVPLDFYRQRYWKNRLRNWLEGLVDDYADASEEFDLDENWKNMRLAWMDTFPQIESEIKGKESKEGTEKKEPDFARYEREEKEAKAMNLLENPGLLLEIDDAIHEFMEKEHRNAMVDFIAGLSTLGDKPINLRWSGRSSVGKSAIATSVIRVFPEEWTLIYVGMTEKSIYYDPNAEKTKRGMEIDLSGKILLILEEENARDFLEEAKPLLSHDMEEHKYGFTDTSGPKPVRREVILKGWPSYIGLSVDPEHSVELGTRELTSTPRMGKDKYGRIVDWKAVKSFAPWTSQPDIEKVQLVKRALSMLEKKKVWIPFIPVIRRHFPTDKARSQRDWDKIAETIKTIALLHQYQRDKILVDDEEYLVAHPFDGLVAIDIMESAIVEAMTGLNRDQIRFHKHISAQSEEGKKTNWTYRDLMAEYESYYGEGIGRTTIQRRYVDRYVECGVMDRDESQKTHTMSVTSPIGPSNLSNLEKMKEELSNIEYGEDYVQNQFSTACGMVGESVNPSHDFELDTYSPDQSAYKGVLSNMKYRFHKAEKEQAFDWESERLKDSKEETKEAEPLYEKEGSEEAKPLFEKESKEEEPLYESTKATFQSELEEWPWIRKTGIEDLDDRIRKGATLMRAIRKAEEDLGGPVPRKLLEGPKYMAWWDPGHFAAIIDTGKEAGDIYEPEPDAYSLKEPESPDTIESIGRTQKDMANSCLEILTDLQEDYFGKVPKNVFVHCCREEAIPQDFVNRWLERAKREGKISEVDEEIEWLGR